MRRLMILTAASAVAFSQPAFCDVIRLTCVSTEASGSHKANYPGELIEALVINPEALTVNGRVWDKTLMHASLESLEFPLCANGICGRMSIERNSGRFIFGREDEISYTGGCKSIPRPRF